MKDKDKDNYSLEYKNSDSSRGYITEEEKYKDFYSLEKNCKKLRSDTLTVKEKGKKRSRSWYNKKNGDNKCSSVEDRGIKHPSDTITVE